jgi:photosystem II stability/assembly factor-like uncharacterized protein
MKIIKYCLFVFIVLQSVSVAEYWKKVTNLPTNLNVSSYWLDIFFIDTLHGWVCGQYTNQVLRTVDGGKTWEASNLPDPVQNGPVHFESIHFIDTLNGFCSGPSGIYKSVDGGNTWKEVKYLNDLLRLKVVGDRSETSIWGCFMLSKDTIYALGGGCDDIARRLIWRSIDGGNTWNYTDLSKVPLPNSDLGTNYYSGLTDVLVYKNGVGYIASSGLIWKTTNYGDSWQIWASPNEYFAWQEEITNIEGTNTILVPYSGNTCNGGSWDNKIGGMIWTNDGINWRKHSTNAVMYGTELISTTEGWACGHYRSVYHTRDAGYNWVIENCGIDIIDDLDDIFFLKSDNGQMPTDFGWVIGNNIYRLVPTEIYVNKDTIDFGTICNNNVSFTDTTTIYSKTYNNVKYSFTKLIDNSYFEIIQPKLDYITTSGCNNLQLVVSFTPDFIASGIQTFAVIIMAEPENEHYKFIDTIFYKVAIKNNSTQTSRDTIDFGQLILGNTYKDSILWYSNIKDTVKLIALIGNDSNYCKSIAIDSIFYSSPDNPKSVDFTIIPQDTGSYLIKYSFLIFPCNGTKDIYIKFSVINVPKIEITDSVNVELLCETYTTISIPIYNNSNIDLIISKLTIIGDPINITSLGFGYTYKNLPITIQPNKSDTLFILVSSERDTTFEHQLKLEHNDTYNTSPLNINIKTTFKQININIKEQIIDFGDVCVGDSTIKNVSFVSNGTVPFTFSTTINENPFYIISKTNNVKQFDTINISTKFSPQDTGTFDDTIICTTTPCDVQFYCILTGRGVKNNIDYSPTDINSLISINQTKEYSINIKTLLQYPISIDSIVFTPQLEELKLLTNYPFILNVNEDTIIKFSAYSEIEKILSNNLWIYYSNACKDSISIPITIEFKCDSIDLIIEPNTINFSDIWADDTAKTKITLTNLSEFAVEITNISFIENQQHFNYDVVCPFTINSNTSKEITICFTSALAGLYETNAIIEAKYLCTLNKTFYISANVPDEKYFIVLRWDTVYATPGDTVSLLATIDSINYPLNFDRIDFNIDLDYKLFSPINLFIISDNNTEHPLNFDFIFLNGINATINSTQSTLINKPLLRLEGIALLSKPTETSVSFNAFNIITNEQYTFTQKLGMLDVSNFCDNDFRGAITFMPEFYIEKINNIIDNRVLNIELSATDKLDVDIEITDLTGNIILTDKINLEKGTNIKQIKLNLATGKYFIKFANVFNPIIIEQIIIIK